MYVGRTAFDELLAGLGFAIESTRTTPKILFYVLRTGDDSYSSGGGWQAGVQRSLQGLSKEVVQLFSNKELVDSLPPKCFSLCIPTDLLRA